MLLKENACVAVVPHFQQHPQQVRAGQPWGPPGRELDRPVLLDVHEVLGRVAQLVVGALIEPDVLPIK